MQGQGIYSSNNGGGGIGNTAVGGLALRDNTLGYQNTVIRAFVS